MKLSKITNTQPEETLLCRNQSKTLKNRSIEVRVSSAYTAMFSMKLVWLNEAGRRELECGKLLDLQLPLIVRITAVKDLFKLSETFCSMSGLQEPDDDIWCQS